MKPLSEVLRPNKLSQFVGQEHLVGKDGPIRKCIENNNLYSMIFWGPPGCGKTTLARIISNELKCIFVEISPTTSGVKDIKLTVEQANQTFFGEKQKTILFIDEIHRFNKAQQDYLLPHVENGTITLIGATTENPSFEIVSPLLSRTRVYKFDPIDKTSIRKLLDRGIRYLKKNDYKISISKEPKEYLVDISNGDARNILNALEAFVFVREENLSIENIQKILQQTIFRYDKHGDEHYDTISAFIKSMRASDVNAALYYLARMIEGGEDPKFIARRMVIFASEDIGVANNNALIVANEVFKAVETVGYPECQLNLSHGAIYLALSKKSRAVVNSLSKAQRDVKEHGNLPIPLNLRNAPTKLTKEMGYGEGYEMYPEGKSLLPSKLKDKKYFS